MAVIIDLPLFLRFEDEVFESDKVTPRELRDLAEDLRGRLLQAAEVLERLQQDGWEAEAALDCLSLGHPKVGTEAQAVRRLRRLGIDPGLLVIHELDEEESDGQRVLGAES
jgi:hypothetical protein